MIEVFVGTNTLLLRQALREARAKFAAENDDTAIEQYDGEQLEPGQLNGILQSLPFLSPKRLVIFRNVSANKPVAEKLQDVLADTPDSTDVIIVESAPDKRTAFYKFLTRQKNVQRFDEMDGPGLTNWLAQEAGERGGKLSSADARYLIERLGTNQLQLSNELDKLLAYQSEVTRQTIELLTERSPQSTVFELLDAAFSGNTKKALKLYEEQRAQRVEPMAIIGMIAWQLHILALVKAAGDRDSGTIAREAKMSPYTVSKSLGLVRNVPLVAIRKWVDDTLELDVNLKTKSLNADDAVQHLLLSFSQK